MTRAKLTFDQLFFFGLVSLTVNLQAKFEVCIFSISRYIREGSQNLKSRSRRFLSFFFFFLIQYPSLSIRLQNLTFVSLAAPPTWLQALVTTEAVLLASEIGNA